MKIIEKKKALKNMVKSFEVDIIERKDPLKQFFYTKPDVAKELESILQKEGGIKAQVTLKITFKKYIFSSLTEDGEPEDLFEYKDAYFNSNSFTILNVDDIIDALDKAAEEILNKIAVWLSDGSGWIIEEILSQLFNI